MKNKTALYIFLAVIFVLAPITQQIVKMKLKNSTEQLTNSMPEAEEEASDSEYTEDEELKGTETGKYFSLTAVWSYYFNHSIFIKFASKITSPPPQA